MNRPTELAHQTPPITLSKPPHDSVIVYEGAPGVEATANAPQTLLSGMNKFLQQLQVRAFSTFVYVGGF